VKLTIEEMGPLGDGFARDHGRGVFVPFALPGEVVEADGEPPRLTLQSVLAQSAERVSPPCPHFGQCGGCQTQHWAAEPYQIWKRDLLISAFVKEGIDVKVAPLLTCPPAARRRATLKARRRDGEVALGFMARGSDELIAIGPCPILRPALEAALPEFATLAGTVLRGNEDVSIAVLEAQNGIAVAIEAEQMPTADMLTALVNRAARSGFLQVAVNSDIVFERAAPQIAFGETLVTPPPGGFLQGVAEIEEKMVALVVGHLKGAKTIVDLYAGSGTFAARLSEKARVHGVESEAAALAALEKAKSPSGARPITAETRDLFEAPLTAAELNTYDAICLDPPRAGAEAQAAEIAQSAVPKVAYVSCDPASLARDAARLVRGGYKLESLSPLDQFLYTPHVEAVALFSKPKPKVKRSIFR
jgi:23S rRNA (uracil1939-C5)-methyltransferase